MTETTPIKRKFDLIIACDILFFKDYHTDLIATLRRLIDPVGGKMLLLQPRRGMHTLTVYIVYTWSVILNISCIYAYDMCMVYMYMCVVCVKGDSLDLFVSKAKEWFEVALVDDYDEQV